MRPLRNAVKGRARSLHRQWNHVRMQLLICSGAVILIMNGSDEQIFGVQEQDPHGREMLKLAEKQKKFDAAKSAAKSR